METRRLDAPANGIAGQRKSSDSIMNMTLVDLFLLLLFNLALFGNAIQYWTGFSYVDEGTTLLLLAGALVCVLKQEKAFAEGTRRLANWAVGCLFAFVAIGLLGNISFGFQTKAAPIAIDMFTCLKFPIALLGSIVVFHQREQLLRAAVSEAKVLTAIALIFATLNLFANFGMGSDPRFGFMSYRFIFGHPTFLVFFTVGLNALLLTDWRRNLPWIILNLITTLFSFRSKGLGYVAMVAILLVVMRKGQRLTPAMVVAICGMGTAIGWNQFVKYFNTPGYARGEMVTAAFSIAHDFFPLGSGFATFGSAVTTDPRYYSPIYFLYGLSSIWGLQPGSAFFVSDTFWPTVLGEFGVIGLAIYVVALVLMLLICYRPLPAVRIAALSTFGYLLISSTSESAFFNPQAVCLAMCLGLILAGQDAGHADRTQLER